MDFQFINSAPATQLDWPSTLNQILDIPTELSQPPPPSPPPPPAAVYPSSASNHTLEAIKNIIYGAAALRPVRINPELAKVRPRRNVRISKDPQSVAARQRRERIGQRIRILQQLVPGGTKMDTASMLEEAICYLKFLKAQVGILETAAVGGQSPAGGLDGGGWSYSISQTSAGQGMWPQ